MWGYTLGDIVDEHGGYMHIYVVIVHGACFMLMVLRVQYPNCTLFFMLFSKLTPSRMQEK